jgi:hypothetical protein
MIRNPFHAGYGFRGYYGSQLLRPVRLLAPWTDLTEKHFGNRGLLLQAFDRFALTVVGYNYNGAGLICWRDSLKWKLASLH